VWARISEVILGFWLICSYFLFPTATFYDLGAALLIFLFAGLSWIDRLNKMHLLQIIPASLLFYIAYSYPSSDLPLGLQNSILIALSLLMFAIIPSHASDHPRPWQRFLDKQRMK
jgi:hypothetical protein